MYRVKGKVAAITGAGTGVGRACMKLFAAEGANVVGVTVLVIDGGTSARV